MTVFGSKRCWTGRVRHLVASLLLVFVGLGETCGAPLNDGWTADGVPVTLPHCWNVADGADGPTDPKAWNHDSVGGTGYARKRVVYRRELPPATPGKVRYVRVHAASIHAVASVDGREVARHAGAFTAFTFAVPADGKILEIAVDNFHDPDVPPVCGDFTVYGGLYRGVDLVEADPSRARCRRSSARSTRARPSRRTSGRRGRS